MVEKLFPQVGQVLEMRPAATRHGMEQNLGFRPRLIWELGTLNALPQERHLKVAEWPALLQALEQVMVPPLAILLSLTCITFPQVLQRTSGMASPLMMLCWMAR